MHHNALQRITAHYKTPEGITMHLTMHYNASQRITRHHSALQSINFYTKAPRKRVRILTFPCKSTEEESAQFGETNGRTDTIELCHG